MPGRKRAYHHGHLREALLDAAERALDSRGVVTLTLRALSRQAGVTHAATYHHFADRSALLRAVAARGFDRLSEELSAPAPGKGAEALRELGVAYVSFAVRHGGLFRLMFSAEVTRGRAEDATLQASALRAFEVLLRGVQRASPEVDEATVRQRVVASWAVVHGLAGLFLEEQLQVVGLTRADHASVTRQVLKGLGWE
jgi:AcrR family transcriptional regulator